MMDAADFQARVLDWFDRHGRKHLPWQRERTPYRVWISEIMLQQTQVVTVVPFFERFMARFPDVHSLAAADLDEVMAHWAGLGYYARARHLHRAARCLEDRHAGAFPADLLAVQDLPGIGRSTAGAILSLGMDLPAPILDGNVKRVYCRYAGLEGWPGEARIERELWRFSEAYTPSVRVADYNQAMMDLGATVCVKRQPACAACPLQADCVCARLGLADAIPAPKPRPALPIRWCLLLVLENAKGEVYLERRPPVGLWGGLLSFPEFADESELQAWCRARGIDLSRLERYPERRHTFSHYHLDFVPVLIRTEPSERMVAENSGHGWFRLEAAGGMPAPVRRLIEEISP